MTTPPPGTRPDSALPPDPSAPDRDRAAGTGSGGEMLLVPSSVLRVARDWDEQGQDLDAAAGQVDLAPCDGFTPEVARAAADFLRRWSGHVGAAASLCEQQGVDLRAVLAAWLDTDKAVAARSHSLLPDWALPWP